MSQWLSNAKPNSTPVWLFVVEARRPVVRGAVVFDGSSYYLTFSRTVREVAEDIILASPYLEKDSNGGLVRRILTFTFSGKTYTATGYRIITDDLYRLELFVETIRYLLIVALREAIKVKRTIDKPPASSPIGRSTPGRTGGRSDSTSGDSSPELVYVVEDIDEDALKRRMGDRLA